MPKPSYNTLKSSMKWYNARIGVANIYTFSVCLLFIQV